MRRIDAQPDNAKHATMLNATQRARGTMEVFDVMTDPLSEMMCEPRYPADAVVHRNLGWPL
jgi:hypothetical protein